MIIAIIAAPPPESEINFAGTAGPYYANYLSDYQQKKTFRHMSPEIQITHGSGNAGMQPEHKPLGIKLSTHIKRPSLIVAIVNQQVW